MPTKDASTQTNAVDTKADLAYQWEKIKTRYDEVGQVSSITFYGQNNNVELTFTRQALEKLMAAAYGMGNTNPEYKKLDSLKMSNINQYVGPS